MTLVSTTAGMAGCAKLLEKGTLSAKSRIQMGCHWQGGEEVVWFSLSEGSEDWDAWRIPWTEEPGGLKSMMSQRFKKDRVTKTFPCLAVYISKGYNLRVVD